MKNVQMGIRHVDTEKLYDTFKNYELYSKYFKYKKQLQYTGLVMVDGETILNNLLLDVNSDDFHKYWDNLEIDKHMSDGGNYRYRHFGCYKYNIEYSCLELLRGKSHFFQSKNINNLNGGVQREFAPVEPHFAKTPLLNALVNFCIRAFPINPKDYCRLKINTHLFRVTCDSKQMGLATPEGIHRDGHSFVSQHLIQRHNVLGGISGIYKNDKEPLFHKQLSNFMDTILVLDDKVMHDVSPIYPNNSKLSGFRDMLIIDYNYV